VLAAVAGLLILAACGEQADDTPPANAQQLPETEAEAFPPHGSPWYPTPAPEAEEDPCANMPLTRGVPHRC
jgi:hypothetical protein